MHVHTYTPTSAHTHTITHEPTHTFTQPAQLPDSSSSNGNGLHPDETPTHTAVLTLGPGGSPLVSIF
jgi:hypothetical protein